MNQLEQIVLDTVSEHIGKQELFTALDITNAVRAGNSGRPQFPCRHREVRDIVRQTFGGGQMTNYDRTNIQVRRSDGQQETAILYFPNHLAVTDIDAQYPDSRRGITATPSPSVVQAVKGSSRSPSIILKPKMLGQLLAQRAAAAGRALMGADSDD